jgi:hypothetical protein
MASPAPKRMTLTEFLEWDDGTDRRYELLDGLPVMMAPSLEAHGEIAVALGAEIRARLQPRCRVISEAGVLIPDRADTYYIADLAVTCAPREPGRRGARARTRRRDPVAIHWPGRPLAQGRRLPDDTVGAGDFGSFQRRATGRAAAANVRRLAGGGPDRQGRDRTVLLRRSDTARRGLS